MGGIDLLVSRVDCPDRGPFLHHGARCGCHHLASTCLSTSSRQPRRCAHHLGGLVGLVGQNLWRGCR